MKYDTDGVVIEIPGQDFIGANHRVQSYPIAEKGNLLWIWMGDPELADPVDIEDYPPLSDNSWRGFEKEAYLHYDANWMLIVDNLADFSHLAFVHANTLGGSEDYAFVTSPEVEKLENGFTIVRWNKNDTPAPYHAKLNLDVPEKLDRCNSVKMIVPGIFFMSTTMAPVGWDSNSGNFEGVKQYRNCQFMTPETKSTTHFFWNYLHDYRIEDPSVSKSLQASLLEGFMEDKEIIEAQQRMLENEDQFQPRGIQGDEAFVHFRKVYNALLKEEREKYNFHTLKIGNTII
jgi:vanillate O-demethylase monooxygenase subunit